MKTFLKFSLPVALASALLAAPSVASAGPNDFGAEGQFTITAERMFGLTFSTVTTERTQGNQTITERDKTTGFSLLAPSGVGSSLNPYTTPHIGFHYTVIPSLTVGAGLGFVRISGESEVEGGGTTVTRDRDPVTAFLIAPRVGYVLGFSDAFYLWLRGGITYYNVSTSHEETNNNTTVKTDASNSGLGLNFDPMFVYTPVNHFGIMFGPVIDLGLSGTQKVESNAGSTTTTVENDSKITNFGFMVGLMGYL